MLYPFIVYGVISWVSPRAAGLVLLVLMGFTYGRRLIRERALVRYLAVQAAGVATLILLSVILNRQVFILYLPIFISLFLLATFAVSLVRPPTMVERFARAMHPDLSAGEIAYCRKVTWVWIGFFMVNATVVQGIISTGDLRLWTFFCGFLSYMIMGTIFAVEYVIRKHQFRRFGASALDRLLQRILPEKTA